MPIADRADADVVVIGSGPGGAVTAFVLAGAGFDVLLLEEGRDVESGAVRPFSREQMEHQYRARGMTTAVGRPAVSYTEGSCVGGGSQVNSGIYHPPPFPAIDRWADERGIDDLSGEGFVALAARVERRLSIRPDDDPGPSGRLLRAGAEALGWHVVDPARWANRMGDGITDRRGMRETYLADALALGVRLWPNTKVQRITDGSQRAIAVVATRGGRQLQISARHVVVAAGAIHTPHLLTRSGLGGHGVGDALRMHPTVKAVAVFDQAATRFDEVAATQVREFSPEITIGHAASRPGLVALGMAHHGEEMRSLDGHWDTASVYYASTCGEGSGSVSTVNGLPDPIVRYRLAPGEASALASGMGRLLHVLLASGADRVYPSFIGAPVVRGEADIAAAIAKFDIQQAPLMTVHLCGSVPLGFSGSRPSAVDSWGRLLAEPRVSVNDASLIPSAPGVNPQGLVTAMALRNAEHLVLSLGGTLNE
jgi:choline dehydrogenase-like flavoprotein